MIPNTENKLDLKRQLINFWQKNKTKILIFGLILIIIISFVIYFNYKNKNKNILIADKYVRAGLYLESNQKNNAKVLYEEIILSKNKFYSILALNAILEKDLILDENKILNYFEVLENSISSKENKDIIKLKKALYLIKLSKIKEGNDLLRGLIEQDSNLKTIAEELLKE